MTTTIGHPSLRGRSDHRVQTRRRPRVVVPGISTMAFWLLATIVTVLNMFGLVMVMSASSVPSVRAGAVPWSLFERQLLWTVLGSIVLAGTFLLSVDFWRRLAKPALFGSIGLLVLVLVPGVGVSPAAATGARSNAGPRPGPFLASTAAPRWPWRSADPHKAHADGMGAASAHP